MVRMEDLNECTREQKPRRGPGTKLSCTILSVELDDGDLSKPKPFITPKPRSKFNMQEYKELIKRNEELCEQMYAQARSRSCGELWLLRRMDFEPSNGLYRHCEVARRPLRESLEARYDLWKRWESSRSVYDTIVDLIQSGMTGDLMRGSEPMRRLGIAPNYPRQNLDRWLSTTRRRRRPS